MPTLFRFHIYLAFIGLIIFMLLKLFEIGSSGSHAKSFFDKPVCPQGEVAVRDYNNMGTVCVMKGTGG